MRLGGFGIDRLDPRWGLNTGGELRRGRCVPLGSTVLREERGYYVRGADSFAPAHRRLLRRPGTFRTDVAVDALVEARRLMDLRGAPITADEVDDAVAYFTGVTPLRYATTDGVADQAATEVLAGLGENYVDRNLAALRAAMTPESATEAYESLVDIDRLTLVVVGDADPVGRPVARAEVPRIWRSPSLPGCELPAQGRQRPLHGRLRFLDLGLVGRQITTGQRLIGLGEGLLRLVESLRGDRVVRLTGGGRRGLGSVAALAEQLTPTHRRPRPAPAAGGIADADLLAEADDDEPERGIRPGAALPLGVDGGDVEQAAADGQGQRVAERSASRHLDSGTGATDRRPSRWSSWR